MSYTQKIRTEISDSLPKQTELRSFMLRGLLYDAKTEGNTVIEEFSTEAAYNTAEKFIKVLFSLTPTRRVRTLAGRETYILTAEGKKLAYLVEAEAADLNEDEISAEEFTFFLRGVFLRGGRINEPNAQSHIEFSFSSEERARNFALLLEKNSLPSLGISQRRNKYIVYGKTNEKICDVLSAIGILEIYYDYINSGIIKQIGNSEHRATNCISGNINRAVLAGSRQVEACEYLIAHSDIGELDSSLLKTARLRIENPTATLTELAELHTLPLTKSGINHRLKKICSIAEKYGYKEKETEEY